MVIADLHCGHDVGLTPPDWDKRPGEAYSRADTLYRHRRRLWNTYAKWCKELAPDILIVNGDAVDGKGEKSGGTEQLTTDRVEQVDMAAACIEETKAKRIVMSYGTSYHSGSLEDWEDLVAKQVEAEKIGSEDSIYVYGTIINYRHHASRSSIPHGRGTPLSKTRFWNMIWAERGEYPKADILLRSHVHYFAFVGEADWLVVSTPALQGYGSKYGSRRMDGTVDFGIIYIDVNKKGEWAWHHRIRRFKNKHSFALEVR
jgi:hypothetical protein